MKARMPLMAGNWKMHFTIAESVALAEELKTGISRFDDREVVVAPPFTAIAAVASTLAGSPIRLSAQNCYWENQGAYTGEISPPMLRDLGCHYGIVGHSERRQYFGETNESVNRRALALLAIDLAVILCIGETLEEKQAGKTLDVWPSSSKAVSRVWEKSKLAGWSWPTSRCGPLVPVTRPRPSRPRRPMLFYVRTWQSALTIRLQTIYVSCMVAASNRRTWMN